MWVQIGLDPHRYAWIHGKLSQVMTTKTQTCVDISVTRGWDAKPVAPRYEIHQHMSELNAQGAYFKCGGCGDAGEILVLPKEATPPRFQPAYIS